jgi:hypothetical protein
MGEAELDKQHKQIIIHSDIITYGDAANPAITESIREEIETMWNEPAAIVLLNGKGYRIVFKIQCSFQPGITPEQIYSDVNPRNNFFRIEEFATGNISFTDGIGSNSGYFKLENLYKSSTTAAHEYGHTIGLEHPAILDIRGKGQPGIMYPRGTLVDPQFQYDATVPAGQTGGTLNPIHRKVSQQDIDSLKLQKLPFNINRFATLGEFSNIYHPKQIP